MQIIPLRTVPNQTLQAQLGGQACTLEIVQSPYGLFMTVFVGATLITASVICLNLNRIVRYSYLGFAGDLVFLDTQGDTDPIYTGLGGATARYQLVYLEPADTV
jgi:hypothetical protein